MFIESVSSIYYYQTNRKVWKNEGNFKTYIVAYQLSGQYDHKFDSDMLNVKADTLVFIPKTSRYSVQCVEPGRSVCISFFGEFDLPPTACDCTANPEIKNLFLKALSYRNLHSPINACEAASIVYSLIAFLFKSAQGEYIAHGTRSKIENAHAYMTEHYTDTSLKIEDVAKRFDMSTKYFRTLFKKRYASTPAQYLISLRLRTAVNLLIESNLSITEVAAQSGFSDVYYFSKLFKERFSFSPKAYRQVQRGETVGRDGFYGKTD